MSTIDVVLLGSPGVRRSGEPVAVDTRKAIAVLAYLAIAGATVARDTLCYSLWPESDQTHARGALRRTLSSLRAAVGAQAIEADHESIRLASDHLDIDVIQFSEHVRRGSSEALESAARLYRGDFLAGFTVRGCPEFEDWQRTEAERLRREADGVLSKLVEIAAGRGDHAAAIDLAERRLELDHLNESAHRMLLLAEAWAGRRDRAISRYRDAVRLLDEELGVSPLSETTKLYEAIRKGETPDLPVSTVRSGKSVVASMPEPPFVGREKEWVSLTREARLSQIHGRLLVLEGEAGIGKTRLAAELAADVERRGGRVAWARCHEGEAELPYAPLAQLLRTLLRDHTGSAILDESARGAVATLVPEFAPGGAALGRDDRPDARLRYYESLRNAIAVMAAGDQPALLVFDDLHLADHATAEFVAFFARRISEVPIVLATTWRRDEIPLDSSLPNVVKALVGSGMARIIRLRRIEDSAVDRIVDAIAPNAAGTSPALTIKDLSEGVPFIAVEYARALDGAGYLAEGVPEPIHSLLAARLDRVGMAEEQVLAAAAVIGREFTPDLIRSVSGRQEDEVAQALDDLESRSLIERNGPPTSFAYDFTHKTLRQVAYERLGAGRRRLLHGRASAALESSRHRSAARAGAAAHHAEAAGDAVHAARLFEVAGALSRSVHANAEAAAYFSQALTLGHPVPDSLHEQLGDLAVLDGDYRVGASEYEGAASLLPDGDTARLEHKLGRLYYRRGDWLAAESYFNAALDKSLSDAFGVEVLVDLATNAHRWGHSDEAQKRADAALLRAEDLQDGRAISRAANVAGLIARSNLDLQTAMDLLEKSRDLARSVDDTEMEIAAANNLARAVAEDERYDAAIDLFTRALGQCREIGDRHREAAILSNLGDVQFAAGLADEAAASVRRSAVIMAEIGMDGEELIPEVWRLTEW